MSNSKLSTNSTSQSVARLISENYQGHKIDCRPEDGYLNATQMCKVGGKDMYEYKRSDATKTFIQTLQGEPGCFGLDLIQSRRGGSADQRGTWIHPRVATHLAMWISPKFGVFITDIIDKWRTSDPDNHSEYMNQLATMKPRDTVDQTEAKIGRAHV